VVLGACLKAPPSTYEPSSTVQRSSMASEFLTLSIDETGNRHPEKKPDKSREGRDWFSIGGVICNDEDQAAIRESHEDFARRWSVRGPLHITDMLARRGGWLGNLSAAESNRFWSEYSSFLAGLPVIGMACVIDRAGYVARGYLEKFAKDRWLLCRSAFDIVVERAVKIALRRGRRLKVRFESDVSYNTTVKGYFRTLKLEGLAFDQGRSDKYNPLKQEDFARILYDIEHKPKANPLMQIADSYVYAISRQRYDRHFDLYRHLRDAKRIANFALPQDWISEMGIKYYCFDPKPDTKRPG